MGRKKKSKPIEQPKQDIKPVEPVKEQPVAVPAA